jgi:serine/threonine-protein kinase
MLVGVIAWKALPFFHHDRSPAESSPTASVSPANEQSKPSPGGQAPERSQDESPSTTSKSAQAPSEDSLRERVQQLGISSSYFNNLVDETFYAKYPQLKGQQSGSKAVQGKQKENWNAIAGALLDRLENLKPETWRKLGSYQLQDYQGWLAELGESGKKNSPTLDALADGRFFKLFPEWKGRTLSPNTMGQVWYAIADEMVGVAKAKKAGKKE